MAMVRRKGNSEKHRNHNNGMAACENKQRHLVDSHMVWLWRREA